MDKQYEELFYKDDRNKKGTQKAKKRTNVRQARTRNEKIKKRQLQKESEQALANQDKNILQEKIETYINGKVTKEQRMKIRQKQRKQQQQEDQQHLMKGSKKIKRN